MPVLEFVSLCRSRWCVRLGNSLSYHPADKKVSSLAGLSPGYFVFLQFYFRFLIMSINRFPFHHAGSKIRHVPAMFGIGLRPYPKTQLSLDLCFAEGNTNEAAGFTLCTACGFASIVSLCEPFTGFRRRILANVCLLATERPGPYPG